MESYIVVDLETTGLNPRKEKIIEIGALKIEKGECVGTFETFVNPGRALSRKVQEITTITDADLEDAPYIEEVLPKYLEFSGNYPLVGHSIKFDFSFLKKAAVNCGFTYEREGVDTLPIAKTYLQDLESKSLLELCKHFGIPHNPHRALGDAKATFELYRILEERYKQEEDKLFLPRQLIYKVKKDMPATKGQKRRLKKLLSYHKLTSEYDIDRLMESEASRYMDFIISHYGQYPQAH